MRRWLILGVGSAVILLPLIVWIALPETIVLTDFVHRGGSIYLKNVSKYFLLFLFFTSLFVGATIVFLAVFLVVRKSYLASSGRKVRSIEQVYLLRVSELLFEEPDVPGEQLEEEMRALAWRDMVRPRVFELRKECEGASIRRLLSRRALREVLWRMNSDLTGETRRRLAFMLEDLGFVRDSVRELKDSRWWVRARACRALGMMRSKEGMFPIIGLLEDDEEDVRNEAALALIEIAGVSEALDPILSNVKSISGWMAIRLSGDIVRLGLESAPHLLKGLDSSSEKVQEFSIRMMGQLKDISVVPSLLNKMDSLTVRLKAVAIVTLGKIGDYRGQPVIERYARDKRDRLRIAAAEALGYLGALNTLPLLEEMFLQDWIDVRLVAAKAIAQFGSIGKKKLQEYRWRGDSLAKAIALQTLDELGFIRPPKRSTFVSTQRIV